MEAKQKIPRITKTNLITFIFLLTISLGTILAQAVSQKTQDNRTRAANSFPDSVNYDSPYGFTLRDPQNSNGGIDQELISEYSTLNVHWIRDQMLWNWTETSPNTYNWSQIDQQVQMANQNGIHIVYVIQSAPVWHQITCSTDGAKYEFDVTGVTAFATALAQRYNGQSGHGFIDSFEIGNEDFDIHYAGGPPQAQVPCRSPSSYVPVLEAAYKAIKANSPKSLVGMFGMWWESKQHEQDFLNGMYQIDPNVGKYFDYGNFHYYTSTSPDTSPGPDFPTYNDRWQIMHSIFEAHGDHNKPIWCTETGWDDVNPTLQNSALQYVFEQSRLSGVVAKVFWYTINWDIIKDIQPGDRNNPPIFNPLPAFNTYQNYVKSFPLWSSITPSPTIQSSPTPTISTGTNLLVTAGLHGIGTGGDNANPNGTGNMNPKHTSRSLTTFIYNLQNILITQQNVQINFDSNSGLFNGKINLNLATGDYLLKFKTDGFLIKQLPGISHIIANQANQIPAIFLISGDITGDNLLDIKDYSALVDCFGTKQNSQSCKFAPTQLSSGADINDDGIVDGADYNLLLREFSVQPGG